MQAVHPPSPFLPLMYLSTSISATVVLQINLFRASLCSSLPPTMPQKSNDNDSSSNKLRQILPYYYHHPSQNSSNIDNIETPPLKIPRLISSDHSPAATTGLEGLMVWNMDPDDQDPPSVGLGLGLTTGGGRGGEEDDGDVVQQEEEEAVVGSKAVVHGYNFTTSQLQELQLQSVIYKYIEAGSGVPPSLLVPIWRSLAAAAAAVPLLLHRRGGQQLHPTLHHLFPSLTQCNLQMLGTDYYRNRATVDPEPGRCRRTDGKKWRCSKEALPDQKYCEKHVHRGRHRSRNAKQVHDQPDHPLPAASNSAGGNEAATGGGGGGGSQSSGSSSK